MTNETNERSLIVQKVASAEKMPDQTKCPTVVFYWTGENKELGKFTRAYNAKTGVLNTYGGLNSISLYRIIQNAVIRSANIQRGKFTATYSKFFPEYKMLELGLVEISSRRGKEGEIRTWNFSNNYWMPRVFLFQDSTTVYLEDGSVYRPADEGKYYNKHFAKDYLHTLGTYDCSEEFRESLREMTNNITFTRYNCEYHYDTTWAFETWYKKVGNKRISKRSIDLSEVCKNLRDIKGEINKLYPSRIIETAGYGRNIYYDFTNKYIAVFEKIEDNFGVIRYFIKTRPYSNRLADIPNTNGKENLLQSVTINEKARIFIDGRKKNVCCTLMENYGNNEWKLSGVPISNVVHAYRENEIIYHNWDEIKTIPALKYLGALSQDEIFKEGRVPLLIDAIRHPILEKLYKSGYKNIASQVYMNRCIAAAIKEYFGITEKKNTTITDLGINKHQLQTIEKDSQKFREQHDNNYYRGDRIYIIKVIKQIFNIDNISTLDNKTFDLYYNSLSNMDNGTKWWSYLLTEDGRTPCSWYNHEEYKPTDADRKHLLKIFKMGSKNERAYALYRDTISTYARLEAANKPRIDIYSIDEYDHLLNLHNELNVLLSNQERARRAYYNEQIAKELTEMEKKLKKLNEDRIEKFEHTNGEYSIIVPKAFKEVLEEGTTLSHCVSNYCRRIGSGETNILFLRKNDNIDTPFYTIEVDNYNDCVQIHGFANKWLGNNPEAIKFVKDWMDERHIRYKKNQLLDTSLHYGASNHFVDITGLGITF